MYVIGIIALAVVSMITMAAIFQAVVTQASQEPVDGIIAYPNVLFCEISEV
jgi:hypothetical protein